MTTATATAQALRRIDAAQRILATIPVIAAAGSAAPASARIVAVVELLSAAGRLLGFTDARRLSPAIRTTETVH